MKYQLADIKISRNRTFRDLSRSRRLATCSLKYWSTDDRTILILFKVKKISIKSKNCLAASCSYVPWQLEMRKMEIL
jgi:hypothetical protein